jgi:regulator of replication initiation timing
LDRYVKGENEQLKTQSQRLQEKNERLIFENKKLYKKLIDSSQPLKRRLGGRRTIIGGGISILIDVVRLS